MLREALRYPGDGDDALFTLAMGGGLHLLAAYLPLVPLVPVLGYLVAVCRTVTTEADDRGHVLSSGAPPLVTTDDDGPLDAVRRLLVDGLAATAVVAGYLAVPSVLMAVTTSGLPQADVSGLFGRVILLGGGTVVVFVTAGFAYLLPAALVAYARDGLRPALDPHGLVGTVRDARYFVRWTGGVVLLAVGVAVGAALRDVAVGFFAVFYAEVAATALFASGVSSRGRPT